MFETVVNENISRQLLTKVSEKLSSLPPPISKAVSHFTLEKVNPRVVSFVDKHIREDVFGPHYQKKRIG
jgi:COP9 signalosome complex subunit 4